ncbi:hypothetical protein TH5_23360, partial [Thalassospira xianhensis MCCC 1A02616]
RSRGEACAAGGGFERDQGMRRRDVMKFHDMNYIDTNDRCKRPSQPPDKHETYGFQLFSHPAGLRKTSCW